MTDLYITVLNGSSSLGQKNSYTHTHTQTHTKEKKKEKEEKEALIKSGGS